MDPSTDMETCSVETSLRGLCVNSPTLGQKTAKKKKRKDTGFRFKWHLTNTWRKSLHEPQSICQTRRGKVKFHHFGCTALSWWHGWEYGPNSLAGLPEIPKPLAYINLSHSPKGSPGSTPINHPRPCPPSPSHPALTWWVPRYFLTCTHSSSGLSAKAARTHSVHRRCSYTREPIAV